MYSELERFPDAIIKTAWERQRGKCAKCGSQLIEENQDKGNMGSWHPHPRIVSIGYDLSDNCILLCTDPPNNCHWSLGHEKYDLRHYKPIEEWEIPYLYGGLHGTPSQEFKQRLKDYRDSAYNRWRFYPDPNDTPN
jgi:hypothetical protein